MVRVVITGFGRIGRALTRLITTDPRYQDIELVAINARCDGKDLLRMLRYDSTFGRFSGQTQEIEEGVRIEGKDILHTRYTDVAKVDWQALEVDVVLECTGRYRDLDSASHHIRNGARKVLISAPGKNVDLTCVFGVNHTCLKPSDLVVSAASCTTNCLAPVLWPIHKKLQVRTAMMTTVHAYTTDQRLLDGSHSDPRRGRSAALSIVPTKTGAASAIGEIMPDLKGRISGHALRVPTANVSFLELSLVLEKKSHADEVNDLMRQAATNELEGILSVNDEPLVSIDFNGDPHSAIFDAAMTQFIGDDVLKVGAWYDNEWGFSNRMLDLARYMANLDEIKAAPAQR